MARARGGPQCGACPKSGPRHTACIMPVLAIRPCCSGWPPLLWAGALLFESIARPLAHRPENCGHCGKIGADFQSAAESAVKKPQNKAKLRQPSPAAAQWPNGPHRRRRGRGLTDARAPRLPDAAGPNFQLHTAHCARNDCAQSA